MAQCRQIGDAFHVETQRFGLELIIWHLQDVLVSNQSRRRMYSLKFGTFRNETVATSRVCLRQGKKGVDKNMVRRSPIWPGSLQSIGSVRWWLASALVMALTSAFIGGGSERALYAEGPEPLGAERTAGLAGYGP